MDSVKIPWKTFRLKCNLLRHARGDASPTICARNYEKEIGGGILLTECTRADCPIWKLYGVKEKATRG